jgi:hypothetical protein
VLATKVKAGLGTISFYKYDTALPFTSIFVSYIKSQIDFFKVSVKRNFESLQLCIQKHKPNKTDVAGIFEEVKFGFNGEKWFENFLINRVIRHREFSPFGM